VGEFAGTVLHTLRNHTGAIRSMDVSHNERLFISASKDTTVKCWNVERASCLVRVWPGVGVFRCLTCVWRS
jgi:WD40 repeat protein